MVEAHFHLFECVWQGVLQIFRNITYWDIWRQCFLIQKLVPVKVFIALSFVFFHGQFLFTLTAIFCLFSNFFTPKVVFFSTKSFDFFTGRKLVIILLRSVIIRKKHRKNAFAKYLRIRLSVFFTGTFAFNGYTFPIFPRASIKVRRTCFGKNYFIFYLQFLKVAQVFSRALFFSHWKKNEEYQKLGMNFRKIAIFWGEGGIFIPKNRIFYDFHDLPG